MSHFTVLVIGDNWEEKLAPYQENLVRKDSESRHEEKWDWYLVGGRWSGLFSIKDGHEGCLGEPRFVDLEKLIRENRADQAKFGDIDWDKTQSLSSLDYYNNLWEWVRNEISDEEALKRGIVPLDREHYINKYGTEEKHISLDSKFATYAVITPDGEWHSSEGIDDWASSFFDKFLRDLSDSTLLTIVDCHI